MSKKQSESHTGKPNYSRELHQTVSGHHLHLTTNQGVAISDNQNSLRANPHGPTLIEDFILREIITHFDHERIPERIVHARGTGIHGFFELTTSLESYTKAKVLTQIGEKIPVFTRLSTVAGGAGSVDTPRDIRGFTVKFYTREGNWDLVGNNIPVFFIQDAIKFPDLIHAVKMEPDRGFPQSASAHDTFWNFISLTPEAMHTVMWIMSDRTIPRSLRMIEGFGVHSFRLINEAGDSTFVKFHWRPKLGLQSTLWDEAIKISGADPDFHRRDMFEAIAAGNFPEWEFAVQLFTQAEADKFPFDHLDPTKLIPEELVPLKVIGHMQMAQPAGRVAYEPNTLSKYSPRETGDAGFQSAAVLETGEKGRIRAESFADHYSQARQFYRSQTKYEQAHMASAFVFELSKVEHLHIREAVIGHLRHVDEDLAGRVALGIALDKMPEMPLAALPVQDLPLSPALLIIGKSKDTLLGRAVGILVADGSDTATIQKITRAAMALSKNSAAIDFVRDAFDHLKAIAVDKGGHVLLKNACIEQDSGIMDTINQEEFITAAKTRQWDREKFVRTLA